MRYVLAQINPTVGDLDGNSARILHALEQAEVYRPDLTVFPMLALTGAPAEDLLLDPDFLTAAERALQDLAARVKGRVLLGAPAHPFFADHPRMLAPIPAENKNARARNAAVLLEDGRIAKIFTQDAFPAGGAFDLARAFAPGDGDSVFSLNPGAPAIAVALGGARAADAPVQIRLNAAPYHRRGLFQSRPETGKFTLECNLCGAQDGVVMAGGSCVTLPDGGEFRAESFAESLLAVEICPGEKAELLANVPLPPAPGRPAAPELPRPPADAELGEMYGALVTGVGDYVRKNGFPGVLVGLSGGIDSALTAAIAVDALGTDAVFGVTMPGRYSSRETRDDARILAENLGIRLETLPIEKPFSAFSEILTPVLAGADPRRDPGDLTPQNLQARVRGIYLMTIANKYGLLVLNTSNKTEGAVGYGTLYGDLVGGYAAIKDVFKTDVWKLSYYVNALHGREVIPVSTIERVPSAELRENQEDRQSLPDYPVLDPILELYLEQRLTFSEITDAGYAPETVRRVLQLHARSEFKRRQGIPGTLLTPPPAGQERRLPATNKFRP